MITTATRIESIEDLRNRIRELAAHQPNPAGITEELLDTITDEECRVVATAALQDYVRKIITRPSLVEAPAVNTPASTPAIPAPRTFETITGARTNSRKIAAVRDWVATELTRSICIDEQNRTWKNLADLTADDCHAAAALRRRKAAQSTGEAERFEKIAAAIAESSAATIGKLPRNILETVLR